MLGYLRKFNRKYCIYILIRNPIRWIYAAYLTIKYVDECPIFPAFQFRGPLTLKIKKGKGSIIKFLTPLVIQPWLGGSGFLSISLDKEATLNINGEFIVGDNVRIFLGDGAELSIGGKMDESGSGITANCVILVKNRLTIGRDCIIAWDTFITDCDWHTIEGRAASIPTIIGDHVWLGVGSKILKGTRIGKDSVVTSNSVVLQGDYPPKSLLSGNPAKIVKNDFPLWRREL